MKRQVCAVCLTTTDDYVTRHYSDGRRGHFCATCAPGRETLAAKRARIKGQRIRANEIADQLDTIGYAAGVRVRNGQVILRCALTVGNGATFTWAEDGLNIKIYRHGELIDMAESLNTALSELAIMAAMIKG